MTTPKCPRTSGNLRHASSASRVHKPALGVQNKTYVFRERCSDARNMDMVNIFSLGYF